MGVDGGGGWRLAASALRQARASAELCPNSGTTGGFGSPYRKKAECSNRLTCR